MIEAVTYLTKQVVALRMRIGERIFQLEKEELRSCNSKRSSTLKRRVIHVSQRDQTSSKISLYKKECSDETGQKGSGNEMKK